ncbi:Wd Repeat-Containing Protein 7 [Manis pentadactyla]|nr:Wd Repeat-Containing Protein 7 [Manis pentadactyla]
MFNPGRLAECGSSGAEAEKLEGGKQSNAMRVTGHQPQPIIGTYLAKWVWKQEVLTSPRGNSQEMLQWREVGSEGFGMRQTVRMATYQTSSKSAKHIKPVLTNPPDHKLHTATRGNLKAGIVSHEQLYRSLFHLKAQTKFGVNEDRLTSRFQYG